MSDRVKIFFLEPTNKHQRFLRRLGPEGCKGTEHAMCDAQTQIEGVEHPSPVSGMVEWPRDDPRWPKNCKRCSKPFRDTDDWCVSHTRIYRLADTGEEMTLPKAPPGACWDAPWYPWKGKDGRCLVVRCPDGRDWVIDSRASNCTMPKDAQHRCWVRHGKPEDGTLHVDKNGETCGAGAGSIDTGKFHGFLRHGYFERC